ncbi:hypothetical protein RclHR1_12220009 [Rhizophagus clarus]|uniref:Uncharacterized protein n=1 Tax=Rhizophagus clarus TaxID=94130 RepID=A0A2Z6QZL7_9GLOM|nr:hypothetical protein RclHR1_12220009 [Rhizophagus clarus]
MYQVLVNWLRKIYGYEITGQWHLEQVCDDGDYHHLYCDLTIKKPESLHLEGLLELLATASISKLEGHFEQVFNMQSEIEETNLLRSSIARFLAENDKIKAENNKIKAENDKIRVENTELKARIAKLEDKQT